MASTLENNAVVSGITIPDSALARQITEFIRDTEPPLLFNHSSRVYYFGALAGKRRGLTFDSELLYAGAMFHDIGFVPAHSSLHDRFEVDGANAARTFLQSRYSCSGDRHGVDCHRAPHDTRHPAVYASGGCVGDSRC